MVDYATLAQLYYNGGWQTHADAVNAAVGVHLERGVSDDQEVKAGLLTWQIEDPTDLYRPSNAASSIYGQTGPYMGAAFATGGSVRFTGQTITMAPGQTKDHRAVAGVTTRGRRWVDVRAGGPLSRVGAWRDPVSSPLFTSITGRYATNMRGYFPLEDGEDSTALANIAAPGRTGRMAGGAKVGNAAGPAGGGTALELAAGASVQLPYASMSTTAGFQIAFATMITTADATQREVFSWRMSNGYTWRWTVDTTNYGLQIYDGSGTNVISDLYSHVGTGAGPGQWVFTRMRVSIVGGAVQIESSWYSEPAAQFWGVTVTYPGTNMGAPVQGSIIANATNATSRYAHHFVVTGISDDLESGDFTAAFNGYRSELAADRFTRLCTSRNLPYVLRGTASKTARMGVQPLSIFLDQLKQLRISEGGLIFDRGDNTGVVLATRDYLYSQAAAPVLDITAAQLSVDPSETDPDVFNVVTAENTTGSSVTAVQTTGRFGTVDPPTGAGRLDKAVKVNLASDGQLIDVANWWLRYHQQTTPRLETIVIDVDSQPGLLTACNAAEPGMFVRLTGRTPDPLLLLILSTAQDTHRKRNVFTFAVAPGAIYRTGVYDATTSRYDSASTTTAGTLTTTAASLAVRTVNYFDCWSTTSTYDVAITGERCTVSAATTPVYSAGYWTQTLTISARSVNGVVKTHAVGEQVQLADPAYYG